MDSEFFYEREAEYYGFTPFQLLDKIGEIVVKSVYSMFDRTATSVLSPQLPFLSVGQIEAVDASLITRKLNAVNIGSGTMGCIGREQIQSQL